jgi:hypothetical protein
MCEDLDRRKNDELITKTKKERTEIKKEKGMC